MFALAIPPEEIAEILAWKPKRVQRIIKRYDVNREALLRTEDPPHGRRAAPGDAEAAKTLEDQWSG